MEGYVTADNGVSDGNGEFKGDVKARLRTAEEWMEKHDTVHERIQAKLDRFTLFQGGLAVLVFVFSIIGPILALKLMGD